MSVAYIWCWSFLDIIMNKWECIVSYIFIQVDMCDDDKALNFNSCYSYILSNIIGDKYKPS